MTRPAATLPWFLGISLAVHALLLVGVYAPQWGGNYRPPPLAVRMATPPAPETRPVPPPTATPSPAQATPARVPPTVTPVARPARREHTPAPAAPASPASPADPATPASRDMAAREAAARVFVTERLRHDIARYFTYPLLARRKGWQGTVRLGFEVSPQGRIRAIRVRRSSGYGVLDRSAVRALEQVGRIEGFADRFAFRLYNVDLPVIYRLDG